MSITYIRKPRHKTQNVSTSIRRRLSNYYFWGLRNIKIVLYCFFVIVYRELQYVNNIEFNFESLLTHLLNTKSIQIPSAIVAKDVHFQIYFISSDSEEMFVFTSLWCSLPFSHSTKYLSSIIYLFLLFIIKYYIIHMHNWHNNILSYS